MKSKLTFFLIGLFLSINAFNQYIYTLPLKVNKMRYDTKRDVIYATVKGSDSKYANSFVSINPYSGQIINSLFVGSEPTEFEFTSDSSSVYICFNELAMIRKFDLTDFTVVQDILLGTNYSNGSIYGQDLATIPGYDSIIIVSGKYKNVSPDFAGIAVYSNGKKLKKETPGHTGPERIESSGSNTIYGYSEYSNVYSVKIDVDSGAYITGANEVVTMKDILYEKGLLFGKNGKVVDTKYFPPIQIGAYPLYNIDTYEKFGVAPDFSKNKTFFDKVVGRDIEFYSFNRTTFAKKDTFKLKNVVPVNYEIPAISNLIRFGKRGLATTVYEDYAFSDNNVQLVLANNLAIVDTNRSIDTLHPDLVLLDTVTIFKYDTIQIVNSDTLIFYILSTSIDNRILSDFKIYPNPTSQYLNVELTNHTSIQDYSLKIYDIQGNIKYQSSLYSDYLYIDVSNFAKGTYILKIVGSDSKLIIDKKILIK